MIKIYEKLQDHQIADWNTYDQDNILSDNENIFDSSELI